LRIGKGNELGSLLKNLTIQSLNFTNHFLMKGKIKFRGVI